MCRYSKKEEKKKRPANPVGALRAASERCALCVQTLKKMRAKEGEFFFSFPKTFQPLKRGLFLIFKRKGNLAFELLECDCDADAADVYRLVKIEL